MGKGNIEKVIELTGNQHHYQKILIGTLGLLWIVMNFIMLGPTYIYMDPVFLCQSTGDQRVGEQTACPIISQCQLIDQFTLTAQLQLYCDRTDDRTGIQSIFSIGSFAGLIIMNMISDTKGRKISMLISTACMIFGTALTIIGGSYNIVPILMIAQVTNGFGGYATVSISYILLADFCFLVESPYVLMGLNKKQLALKSAKKICKFNKLESNLKQIEQILWNQQQKTKENQASIKNVLKIVKQKQNLKPILLLTLIYGVGNISYYGTMYSIDTQGNGFGLNSMSSGGVEMLSFVYLGFFVTRLSRRKGIALFYGLSIIVGVMFVFPAIKNDNLAVVLLICINRLFSCIGYTMIACMQVECFTVQIQSTACGLIQAFSLFGVLLAPILVDIADSINLDPIVFLSIISTFAVWPNIFLKQTLPSVKQKQNVLLDQTLLNSNSETLIYSIKSQKSTNQQSSSILTEQDNKIYKKS